MSVYEDLLFFSPPWSNTQVTNDRHQLKLVTDTDMNWNDLLRKLANYILVTINTTKVGV